MGKGKLLLAALICVFLSACFNNPSEEPLTVTTEPTLSVKEIQASESQEAMPKTTEAYTSSTENEEIDPTDITVPTNVSTSPPVDEREIISPTPIPTTVPATTQFIPSDNITDRDF